MTKISPVERRHLIAEMRSRLMALAGVTGVAVTVAAPPAEAREQPLPPVTMYEKLDQVRRVTSLPSALSGDRAKWSEQIAQWSNFSNWNNWKN